MLMKVREQERIEYKEDKEREREKEVIVAYSTLKSEREIELN